MYTESVPILFTSHFEHWWTLVSSKEQSAILEIHPFSVKVRCSVIISLLRSVQIRLYCARALGSSDDPIVSKFTVQHRSKHTVIKNCLQTELQS